MNSARRSPIRAWMVWLAAFVVVVAAGAMTTKVVSIEDAEEAAASGSFDPVAYADERFESEIAPQIEEDAVDLAALLADLAEGADEAEFGHAPGTGSSYSFPVTFTGVVGAQTGSLLEVAVDGLPEGVAVQVQVGPALNGTALRDVTGTVSFNEFTNQLEFQEVATELNNRVRDGILAETTIPAEGQSITVTGAFTRVNPALVSVVPISIESAQ